MREGVGRMRVCVRALVRLDSFCGGGRLCAMSRFY